MKCPRCGSSDVIVQAVVEHHAEPARRGHGIVWWLLVGWWWAPVWWLAKFLFRWVVILPITLVSKALGWGRKDKELVAETRAKAVCQTCGHVWEP